MQCFEVVLHLFQEIEDRKNEGIFHGNIGEVLLSLNRKQEALTYLHKAIDICDEFYPPGAGVFRGSLAIIFAEEGKLIEARELLKKGEPQVSVLRVEYGKFLCRKGQIELNDGHREPALKSIKQAKNIAQEAGVNTNSELGLAITNLENKFHHP